MSKTKRELALGEPVCFEYVRRVQFADTDMAGIVHFSAYYRYMEEAEHAFFRSLGETVHARQGSGGVGWPRLHAACDFFSPIRFEDEVRVGVAIHEIRSKTVRFHHHFWLAGVGGDELVATGSVVTVCVSLGGAGGRMESIAIPAPLRDKLEAARRRAVAPGSRKA